MARIGRLVFGLLVNQDRCLTTAFDNTALKTGSICSFTPVNPAISPVFVLSYLHS
jgi:hypothetical protein